VLPALTCGDTYIVSPTYPAVLNGSLTGISGAACVACAVIIQQMYWMQVLLTMLTLF
jgi:hypothetical protein